jgi:ribosomal protein L7/L12
MSLTSEAKQEVQRLLQLDQKINAVKYLHKTFDISLAEAAVLVEAVENDPSPYLHKTIEEDLSTSSPSALLVSTALDGALKSQVIALLASDKKIEAIKVVKSQLNTGLKEALEMVEEVEQEMDPSFHPTKTKAGFKAGVPTLFKVIFGTVGIALLTGALLVYISQQRTIGNSKVVTGKVVDFQYSGKGGSAPVILFEWNGQRQYYRSTLTRHLQLMS